MILLLDNIIQLDFNDLPQFLKENMHKDFENKKWACSICGFTTLNKVDVARHIEAKHVSLPELLCPTCGKPSKNRNALRVHMKVMHNQVSSIS